MMVIIVSELLWITSHIYECTFGNLLQSGLKFKCILSLYLQSRTST